MGAAVEAPGAEGGHLGAVKRPTQCWAHSVSALLAPACASRAGDGELVVNQSGSPSPQGHTQALTSPEGGRNVASGHLEKL
ncbi:hypothetical protein H8959_012549 [Pygathrix nigripes]